MRPGKMSAQPQSCTSSSHGERQHRVEGLNRSRRRTELRMVAKVSMGVMRLSGRQKPACGCGHARMVGTRHANAPARDATQNRKVRIESSRCARTTGATGAWRARSAAARQCKVLPGSVIQGGAEGSAWSFSMANFQAACNLNRDTAWTSLRAC